MIRFTYNKLQDFLSDNEIDSYIKDNFSLIQNVLNGNIGDKKSLGWFDIDHSIGNINDYIDIANEIHESNSKLIVVGVGGSNRSALSVIEGLYKNNNNIFYLGNNFSAKYFTETIKKIDGDYYVNIIAKNFHTLEPGVAFSILRKTLKEKYGENYSKHIILTGSYGDDQLSEVSKKYGFRFIPFLDDIGGRFSAFSSVALLPLTVSDIDINKYINGARNAKQHLSDIAVKYAVIRHLLMNKGYTQENLAIFEPSLENLAKWWVQLHGETEGKTSSCIFPSYTNYSEDLHSLGQYIQEGRHNIFETYVSAFFNDDITIDKDIDDGFDFLCGKGITSINKSVYNASIQAHLKNTPCIEFIFDSLDENSLAEFMYVNMLSSYLSAALLKVDPFDQPGVEEYKKNLINSLK